MLNFVALWEVVTSNQKQKYQSAGWSCFHSWVGKSSLNSNFDINVNLVHCIVRLLLHWRMLYNIYNFFFFCVLRFILRLSFVISSWCYSTRIIIQAFLHDKVKVTTFTYYLFLEILLWSVLHFAEDSDKTASR